MKSFFDSLKKSCYLQGVITVLLGLVLIIFPSGSVKFVCIALGVGLVVSGAVDIIGYFSNADRTFFQSALFTGILYLGLGIWMLVNPGFFLSLFQIVLGVFIVIHGAADCQQAFSLKRVGYDSWQPALVIGVLTIGLGAFIVLNPFGATVAMTVFFGVVLLFDGVSDLWIASRISKLSK
ncbi:HdeD family acid-resistance protein [Feifania hominis]|uniref:DUF308 domain-containing protein n=1 Tax=Feifania hominis TaxID=2763660 RepID=A0A926HU46_9FIRM|nr:DUF308 domain-containing protein [Feifania hominis]MBC8535565.1 DUF308 domain-containing protein [Feifania hominis]